MKIYKITRKNGSGSDVTVGFITTNTAGVNSYVCQVCSWSCPNTSAGASVRDDPNGLVMLDLINHVSTHL